jgi:hypothetical protein
VCVPHVLCPSPPSLTRARSQDREQDRADGGQACVARGRRGSRHVRRSARARGHAAGARVAAGQARRGRARRAHASCCGWCVCRTAVGLHARTTTRLSWPARGCTPSAERDTARAGAGASPLGRIRDPVLDVCGLRSSLYERVEDSRHDRDSEDVGAAGPACIIAQ